MTNNNTTFTTKNIFMNSEMMARYHLLTIKPENDRTKEEKRELETLKKFAHMNGNIQAIINLVNNYPDVSVLEYDNVAGLYRIQITIAGKQKTIARIKIAKRDTYILVRETTAKELNKTYEIINYNLPAGYHVTQNLYNELVEIAEYHRTKQTA